MNNQTILVLGSGYMAEEYLKVIDHLNLDAIIIGNRKEKVAILSAKFSNYTFHAGGLESNLHLIKEKNIDFVINCVNVELLFPTTEQLIKEGVKNILIEKPGSLYKEELVKINNLSIKNKTNTVIGYNRRFYPTVNKVIELAKKEGDITNVHFEFTEWSHRIDPSIYSKEALRFWLISNSSHVLDTVFYLIGKPQELVAHVAGKKELDWHPSGSIFTGAGLSDNKIPFTYNSNWKSAGRWSIEVFTKESRYFLCPMEQLFVQKTGTILKEEVILPNEHEKLKMGLTQQTIAFLNQEFEDFCSLEFQINMLETYYRIGNYQ